MIGRLANTADFERMFAAPIRSRSAHFAVHHLASGPPAVCAGSWQAAREKLSTASVHTSPQLVDDPLSGHWIGCVVPKRHARRAVTRSLLKRQIRSVFFYHAAQLPAGQWLVRLRSPFAPSTFVSASSARLAQAARDELDHLLTGAA